MRSRRHIAAPATFTAAVAVALVAALGLPHEGRAAARAADISAAAVPHANGTPSANSAQCRTMMAQFRGRPGMSAMDMRSMHMGAMMGQGAEMRLAGEGSMGMGAPGVQPKDTDSMSKWSGA